ncbi:MAG: DNA topoisomerase IB [Dehalococcoidia bacterium]|nr:DNA topoisomerase IB [Dehalococcoidia bacterium]
MDVESSQEPLLDARAAGLRHVSDQQPGIRRSRAGHGFTYLDPDGKPLRDREEVNRIKRLAIPPAWTDVWISPSPRGHIQATGRDARGRKQYRYHPRWREQRDETKFHRMLEFANALPRIRARTDEHLRLHGLPREKVLATVVRLLEATLIRVGNEEYAKSNNSFGLTTMKDGHVKSGSKGTFFRFQGKSGKKHEVRLSDRRLAQVVKRCRDIPGSELFQYVDDEGRRHAIDSGDVNDYLREISGSDFTAKDFRTWSATVLCALALREFESFDSESEAIRNVAQAVEAVSRRLGNTPTICRKSYIHPEVIDAYVDGSMLETFASNPRKLRELSREEAAVAALLGQRLGKAKRPAQGDNESIEKALRASLSAARRGRR